MSEDSLPDRYGQLWERNELILAFELYCRIPFRKTKQNNPLVIELADLLNRSPASVARKLGNFGAFDPELQRRQISGLGHGSKLDEAIWDEFHADWNGLVLEAAEMRASLEALSVPTKEIADESHARRPSGESEVLRLVKQRRHQSFFRDAVLSSYGSRCCITGLPVIECLVASHIVPWSRDESSRSDPANGVCLHALADRLFDAGLMTIDADLKVLVCSEMQSSADESVHTHILPMHGRAIRKPYRFVPREEYLSWHRENLFKS